MEILGKLFGSTAKVKLLRLFLLNPDTTFSTSEVEKRSRTSATTCRYELRQLEEIGLVTKKSKNNHPAWQLNRDFPLLANLRGLVKSNLLDHRQTLVRHFNQCGKISLLIAAGVLVDGSESRADILVVGDRVKRGVLDRTVKGLEAELGQELSYVLLNTDDFNYRVNASDKFLRDILEYPHERLIDKLIHSDN